MSRCINLLQAMKAVALLGSHSMNRDAR
jgi:hypothetical protein